MLHLAAPTRDDWLPEALGSLDAVLLDHAHCEKKAASTALALLFRYPHHAPLLRPLSEVVREEMTHFEEVLGLLSARGVAFARLRPGPYARRLHEVVRAAEPAHLLDTLLCCALIEARSCERMKLLGGALDGELGAFYRSLLASEARHFALYVDLARRLCGAEVTEARLAELARHEAEVLAEGGGPVRMHS